MVQCIFDIALAFSINYSSSCLLLSLSSSDSSNRCKDVPSMDSLNFDPTPRRFFNGDREVVDGGGAVDSSTFVVAFKSAFVVAFITDETLLEVFGDFQSPVLIRVFRLCKALLDDVFEDTLSSLLRTIAKFSSTSAPSHNKAVFGPNMMSTAPTVATMKPTAMIMIRLEGVGSMERNTMGNVMAQTKIIKYNAAWHYMRGQDMI